MTDIVLWLILAAVSVFGFCIVDYLGRSMDEIRRETRPVVKGKESQRAFHSKKILR